MSFDSTLTISDGVASHAYESVDNSKPFAVLRQVDPASASLDSFERLHIAHTLNEKTRVSSSKIEFTLTKENPSTGKLETAKVRQVVEIPRATFTGDEIKVLMNQAKNFESSAGYQDKVINMES